MECFFDGAITVNPGGLAQCGYKIIRQGQNEIAKTIEVGEGAGMSCNVAEWHGLLNLLRAILELNPQNEAINIYGDSQLVINGINGKWRVKAEHLKGLASDCKYILEKLSDKLCNIKIQWISREFNKADEYSRTEPVSKWSNMYKNIDKPALFCSQCGHKLKKKKKKKS